MDQSFAVRLRFFALTFTLLALLPLTTVAVMNVATNVTATIVTNNDGYFTAPDLLVGGYTVSATKEEFKKALRSGNDSALPAFAEFDYVQFFAQISLLSR